MSLEIEIDRADLDRYIAESRDAIGRLIDVAAEDLSRTVGSEASSSSRRLADAWPVETQGEDRRVFAPEFFAHFLARGTREHGPTRADRMVFAVDGQTVWATRVAGVRPNPFGERAIVSTESRLDEIVTRAFAEVP